MIIDCAVYQDGKRRPGQLALDDAYEASLKEDAFVWIGLYEPDEAEFDSVRREFNLHELAVEDAIHAHQRPKLEVYDHSLFVVLRTAELKGGRVDCGETHIFIGPGYVITVRHGASSSYSCCVINPTLAQ
jgi:magnesium transporter